MAAGIGPSGAATISAVARSASTNGRGSAPRGLVTCCSGQTAITDTGELPAAFVAATGRKHFGGCCQRCQPLCTRGASGEVFHPITHGRSLLVAVRRGQLAHAIGDPAEEGVTVAGQELTGRATSPHMHLCLPSLTRRAAPSEFGHDARAPTRALPQPGGALSQRNRLVDRSDCSLSCGAGPERADVTGRLGAHLSDDRQSRKGLVGELDPHGSLGPGGAAVVGRLVSTQQPDLLDLGLQDGLAHDRMDGLAAATISAIPSALLGGREVAPRTIADVVGRADVECATLAVSKDVDPGAAGSWSAQEALSVLRRGDARGVTGQLLQCGDPEVADPAEEGMEHVCGGQCVVQRPVIGSGCRAEEAGQRGEFVIAGLIGRDQMAGQDHGVEDAECRPRMTGLVRRQP